jgi:hypothetical protein
MEHPVRLIVIGFLLLLAGAVLPFVMVINLLESTLFLNIVSVLCTVSGIILGFLGITQYARNRR